MPTIKLGPASPTITKKSCKVCWAVKPIAEFSKEKRTADGYCHECKKCLSARRQREKIERDLRKRYKELTDGTETT